MVDETAMQQLVMGGDPGRWTAKAAGCWSDLAIAGKIAANMLYERMSPDAENSVGGPSSA
jgi:hypothetical protein